MTVRPASRDDLALLPDLERVAAEAFRGLGMAAVADDPPPTVEELDTFRRDGRAWVHLADDGAVAAYALAEVVDGHAHIAQVTVHPRWARRRLGARLLDVVEAWARDRGLPALSLTTFAHVPWNAPYYRRLGFVDLAHDALGPQLLRIREAEAARGLDRWERLAMRRPVTPGAGLRRRLALQDEVIAAADDPREAEATAAIRADVEHLHVW